MTTTVSEYRRYATAAGSILNDKYHTNDVQRALALADYMQDIVEETKRSVYTIDQATLVDIAKDSVAIQAHVAKRHKINAIKHLRLIAKVGLKEAKEAVELAYPQHVWYPPSQDEEPPF